MKERPILMSGEMVRAILDGRKTMTRRVVKPQPHMEEDGSMLWSSPRYDNGMGVNYFHTNREAGERLMLPFCPYGKVGDRLWVRETWQPFRRRTAEQEAKIKAWFDKADHSNFMNEIEEWSPMPDGELSAMYAADFGDWAFDVDSDLKPWKSPIFMPRWASRITLEITGVRVERLNEISENEAQAEGVPFCSDERDFGKTIGGYLHNYVKPFGSYLAGFIQFWDKINGKKHPWASNPFVWVVEFKRV